jgi:DNA-binding MarR family transcriptional regulator
MTRWLSVEEQAHWRSYITASTLLDDRLSRELQESHGLTMADYEILVRLSEAPDRRLRMSTLADLSLASRSRLSHQVDRLEKAGLVERQPCESDRRGFLAVLTEHGWEVLVAAAPTHVEGVRRHLVDVLTEEEFAAVGRALCKVATRLQAREVGASAPDAD